MSGESKVTTDHKKIQKWAEERKAQPCRVKGTGGNEDPGLLRLNFPGYDENNLEEISWDDFFEKFDEKDLAFLYQDKKSNGETSNFFKFVSKETAEHAG
jgi:hypothetical protein